MGVDTSERIHEVPIYCQAHAAQQFINSAKTYLTASSRQILFKLQSKPPPASHIAAQGRPGEQWQSINKTIPPSELSSQTKQVRQGAYKGLAMAEDTTNGTHKNGTISSSMLLVSMQTINLTRTNDPWFHLSADS